MNPAHWRVPLLALAVGLGWAQQAGAQENASATSRSLQALQLTSVAIRQAVTKIQPSLVTIVSTGGVKAVAGRIGGIREQGEGNTTGVVVSSDGWVVTSTFNFIQRPPVITVITADGQAYVADLMGQDNTRKICLLKIRQPHQLVVPELVPTAEIQVGQWAISVGVGFGDSNPAISSGIISAKNRVGGKAIQTDANISPACYGGPLIDLQGRLLGICVPLNPQSQAIGAGVEWYDSGIGFAIPLSDLESVLERLKKGEKIEPAFLGVQAAPTDDQPGLLIQEVVPQSAAATAGLVKGERILAVNGEEVVDVSKFKQLLSRFEAGQSVELQLVTADQQTRSVSVTLSPPPVDPKQSQLEPPRTR